MGDFLAAVFTPRRYAALILILALAAIGLALFLDPSASLKLKIASSVLVVLLYIAFSFIDAAYHLYLKYTDQLSINARSQVEIDSLLKQRFPKKLIVDRQVQQAGSSQQADSLIAFENPGFLREGSIVTLMTSGSGLDQPIALLRIIRSVADEPLQAKAFPEGEILYDLGGQIKNLYITPTVHLELIEQSLAQSGSARLEAAIQLFTRTAIASSLEQEQ